MKVSSIALRHWRNINSQVVSLNSGLNILMGSNAQGKTNIIESIYMCCLGKSPRTDKDKELIMWRKDVAHIKLDYSCRYGDGQIAIGLWGNKKSIAINSVNITKIGDLLGYLNCIYFSPNDIRIVSSSPDQRRKFMDIDLCQIDKAYYYSLVKHNKALVQRNSLLKKASNVESLKEQLFIWDEIIADTGAKVIAKRKQFANMLSPLAEKCHATLTDNQEKLQLQYNTTIKGEAIAEIKDNYLETLNNNVNKDFNLRYTSAGCQRDDISFVVNGKDIRTYGSQGQLRTTALALKLAELEIFSKLIGEYPVLILDDVLSELDVDRQQKLLGWANTQIILTTATEIDSKLLPDSYTTLIVENGQVRQ